METQSWGKRSPKMKRNAWLVLGKLRRGHVSFMAAFPKERNGTILGKLHLQSIGSPASSVSSNCSAEQGTRWKWGRECLV